MKITFALSASVSSRRFERSDTGAAADYDNGLPEECRFSLNGRGGGCVRPESRGETNAQLPDRYKSIGYMSIRRKFAHIVQKNRSSICQLKTNKVAE